MDEVSRTCARCHLLKVRKGGGEGGGGREGRYHMCIVIDGSGGREGKQEVVERISLTEQAG